jgi:hypothetical protein
MQLREALGLPRSRVDVVAAEEGAPVTDLPLGVLVDKVLVAEDLKASQLCPPAPNFIFAFLLTTTPRCAT